MNAAWHSWTVNVARDVLIAMASNPAVVENGPSNEETVKAACDAADALQKEVEKRGWDA